MKNEDLYPAIRDALFSRINSSFGDEFIIFPHAAPDPKTDPPTGVDSAIRPHVLWPEVFDIGISDDGPQRMDAMLQVDCLGRVGTDGAWNLEELAGKVSDAFRRGVRLSDPPLVISVMRSWANSLLRDDQWFMLPVRVHFVVFFSMDGT